VLGAVGISSVFKHVICKLADGVEVFGAVVCIGRLYGEAGKGLANKQYGEHGLLYESSSHVITSRVLGHCVTVARWLGKASRCAL